MRTTRLIWAGVATGLATLVSGCTLSHAMQQDFDDGSCPARYLAPTSANRPEAGAGNLLTWSGPTETRDIDKIEVWCRTVESPILLDPTPPRLQDGTSVDSLAIVTWNTNVGGGDLVAFLAQELEFPCDPAESATLRPSFHFVILLQEVYRASSRLPEAQAGPNIPVRLEPDPPPGGRCRNC